MKKNYYQVLRIGNSASSEEISDAYKRMRQRIASSGIEDPDTLALLKDAFDTLSDPASRASYDQSLTVPEAVIKLKQGFGRLIRSRTDRGIVVILDPRVLTKPYGRTFLSSLPNCPRVAEELHTDPL